MSSRHAIAKIFLLSVIIAGTLSSYGKKAEASLYIYNGSSTTTLTSTSPYSSNISLTATSTLSQDAIDLTQYTLSGIISGSTFGVTVQNLATTTFSGVNTYSGMTTVSGGGILSVSASNNFSSNVAIATSSTFIFNVPTAGVTLTKTFSGGGNLNLISTTSNSAYTTISSLSGFTGNLNLSTGVGFFGNTAATNPAASSTVNITNAQFLIRSVSGVPLPAGVTFNLLGGYGDSDPLAYFTIRINTNQSGISHYLPINVLGASSRIGCYTAQCGTNYALSGPMTIADNLQVELTCANPTPDFCLTSDSLIYSGAISGLGGISKKGHNTWTISNATQSYTGTTTVTNGTLAFTNSVPASTNWVINYIAGYSPKITLPASPTLTGKTINIVSTSTSISATTTLVSWTGTAVGTPIFKWNGTVVSPNTKMTGTQIALVSSSTTGISLQATTTGMLGPVTGLATTTAAAGSVALSWTAPTSDGGSPITDYQIDYFELKNLWPVGDSITNGTVTGAWRAKFATNVNTDNKNISLIGRATDSSLQSSPVNQQGFIGRSSYATVDSLNNMDGVNTDLYDYYGGAARDPISGYWINGTSSYAAIYPDFTTIQLGTNDCNRETDFPAVNSVIGISTYTRNLSLLVDKIFSLRPSTKIYVSKVTPSTLYTSCLSQIWPMVDTVVSNFQSRGYTISMVDLSGMPLGYLSGDSVHPTQTGYDWIGDQWYNSGISAATPWTSYAHTATTSTTATISGLNTGVTYFFRVIAKNAVGSSSDPAYVKNAIASGPSITASLLPSAASTTTLSFAWSSASGATAYTYSVSTAGIASPVVVTTGTTTSTSVTVTGLNPGTRYAFTMRSTNGTVYSKALTVGTSTLIYAPTSLAAGSISTTGATLSWSSMVDMNNFNTDLIYSIFKDGVQIATVPSTTLSYAVSGLSSGTAYNFTVSGRKTSYAYSEPNMVGTTVLSYSTSSASSISAATLTAESSPAQTTTAPSLGLGFGGFTSPSSVTAGIPVVKNPPVAVTFSSNLSEGMISPDVKLLQKYLNTHGFPVSASGVGSAGNETTYFGLATKAALVRFQAASGIVPASGYFGPTTRAFVNSGKNSAVSPVVVTTPEITATFSRPLSPGSSGPDVSALQQKLKKLGYYTHPEITGYYGPVTQAAVQAFQSAKGIVSSGTPGTTGYGRVGPRTIEALMN